jgi:hypothetical protein
MGSVIDNKKIGKEIDWLKKNLLTSVLITSKPEEALKSFESSAWVRKNVSSRWYKTAEVTSLETTVVHSLLAPDWEARIRYCKLFQE